MGLCRPSGPSLLPLPLTPCWGDTNRPRALSRDVWFLLTSSQWKEDGSLNHPVRPRRTPAGLSPREQVLQERCGAVTVPRGRVRGSVKFQGRLGPQANEQCPPVTENRTSAKTRHGSSDAKGPETALSNPRECACAEDGAGACSGAAPSRGLRAVRGRPRSAFVREFRRGNPFQGPGVTQRRQGCPAFQRLPE